MSVPGGWRRLLRLRAGAKALEREIDDEIAFHLDMRAAKLREAGADTPDAAAEARFGERARVREELLTIDRQFAREARVMGWIESIAADLRYAWRTFRRAPVFTIAAVATLALGVGATSAMFSLVDGIVLRALPYPHPEQLVSFRQSYPEKGLDAWPLSEENVAMYRDGATRFASFAAYSLRGVTLGGSPPRRLAVAKTTGEFFDVIGVPPLIGHAYTNADDQPHRSSVAVLSYGFWQSQFAGRRDAIGKVIDIDDSPVTVVGVMPPGFSFPRRESELWMPLGLDPSRRFGWYLAGIARLRPGATIEQAHEETSQILRRWAAKAPGLLPPGMTPERTKLTTLVRPLQTAMIRDTRRPLLVLQAAVLLMLLIAIANVATLQSSRAAGRGREIALRGALGATRARVGRQLLTESVALALAGAAGGIVLAAVVVRAFTHASPIDLPRLDEVSVNGRVLAFTLAIAIGSGLLFGLAPLSHALRARGTSDLTGGIRESTHRGVRRVNNGLIVAQLALSVLLLVSAGLMLKSFRRLVGTDLGFEPRGATAITVPLPQGKYRGNASVIPFVASALPAIRAQPDVRGAAFVQTVPLSGGFNTDGYLVEGHAPPAATGTEKQVVTNIVTPGYFSTMGIRMLRGRDFTTADRDSTVPVTIIDETLAREYWPDLDALGKRMRLTGDTTWLTIVGVARNIHDDDVASAFPPHMYTPIAQAPTRSLSLVVRGSGDGTAAVAAARRTLHQLEPALPLDGVHPLTENVGHSLDTRRMTELLLAGFAALAVLLASVGIYGVMSLYVAARTREFGIRMAVGAEPARVVRLVLGEGLALAAAGVAAGAAGAWLASRWLASLLYGVSTHDPIVFSMLPLALLVIAVASCVLPARRAAKADPLAALRAD